MKREEWKNSSDQLFHKSRYAFFLSYEFLLIKIEMHKKNEWFISYIAHLECSEIGGTKINNMSIVFVFKSICVYLFNNYNYYK